MGRPRIKTIDDSQSSAEIKSQKLKVKTSSKKAAKLESVEAISEVESTKTEARGDGEEGVPAHDRNERIASEDVGPTLKVGRETEPAGPRATEKKSQKPGKAKPRSKKYQEISKDLDRTKTYPLDSAVDMVKKLSYAKFNATLEAHINTLQTGIRGLVTLPYAKGKKIRILAFGKGADQSGADIVGNDEVIETINKGKVDFDLVITTPEWMPKLAKVARILGPRDLMPNPKNGTIIDLSADGLKKAVAGFQTGKTEYKTESKVPVIHIALGKLNQPNEELVANIKTLLQTLGKSRVKKFTLSPTMGPSVKVDLSSL